MTKQKLEPQYARLTKIEGFTQAFWEFCCDFKKQEEAYDAVERQYIYTFGHRRYKNFNSFRRCRDSYIKKKNEEKSKD